MSLFAVLNVKLANTPQHYVHNVLKLLELFLFAIYSMKYVLQAIFMNQKVIVANNVIKHVQNVNQRV